MTLNDCYEIPGLSRSTTQDDGKYAWRKPARKCHPDPGKDPAAGSRLMKP